MDQLLKARSTIRYSSSSRAIILCLIGCFGGSARLGQRKMLTNTEKSCGQKMKSASCHVPSKAPLTTSFIVPNWYRKGRAFQFETDGSDLFQPNLKRRRLSRLGL